VTSESRRRAVRSRRLGAVPAAVAPLCSGVCRGYFAAQSILLLGILGLFLAGDVQQVNAVGVILAGPLGTILVACRGAD